MVDFKSFHLRAIHAETEQEKQKINLELKSIYEQLSEEDKKIFNESLQLFLMTEMGRLGSDYQAIKNNIPENY